MAYSYIMFMVPASNVSVPFTVVMRTWVSVSERALVPQPSKTDAASDRPNKLISDQVFEPSKEIFICPCRTPAAAAAVTNKKPLVKFVFTDPLLLLTIPR